MKQKRGRVVQLPATIIEWPQRLNKEHLRGVGYMAAVLALAILCRSVYLHQFTQSPLCHVAVGPDVQEYDGWAREILAGRVLWDRLHIHAPLYAYVLAGLHALTRINLCMVRACQLALDVLSLLLVTAALRQLLNRRVAVMAGALWAVYLPLIYHSAELHSEALLLPLLSGAYFVWAKLMMLPAEKVGLRCVLFLCFGFLLGLAAITHPLSLLASAALVAALTWRHWRWQGRLKAITALAITLSAMSLPIMPVTLRNYVVSGEFVLIQAREGLNFYIGNNDEATGTPYVRPGRAYDRLVAWPERLGIDGETAGKRFFYRHAFESIRARPIEWSLLLLNKLMFTWNAAEIPSGADLPDLQIQTPLMRLPLLRFGLVGPMALAGIWFGRKNRRWLPFVTTVAAYSLALTVFVTSARYRLGMIPAVIALAAGGIDGFVLAWQRDDRREFAAGVLAVTAGVLLAFVPVPPPLPSLPVESASLMAEAAWRHGDPDLAQQWLDKGLTADPEDPGLNHLRGVILSQEGRLRESMFWFRRALRGRPDHVKTRVDLAIALSEFGCAAEALDELHRALEIRPRSADVWYNLGVVSERDGQAEEAMRSYRKAVEHDPTLASAHLNLGVLYHRRGNLEDARGYYRTALRLAPRNPRALMCMGVLLAETDEAGKAKEFFQRSLTLDPKQPDGWDVYIRFLEHIGQTHAAEQARQQAHEASARSSVPGNAAR